MAKFLIPAFYTKILVKSHFHSVLYALSLKPCKFITLFINIMLQVSDSDEYILKVSQMLKQKLL